MPTSQKRPHIPSPPAVTVELDLSEDELERPPSPELPKRRRGRPRAVPQSIQFEVQRTPTSDANERSNTLRANPPVHPHAPEPNAPTPPLESEQPPENHPCAFDGEQAGADQDSGSDSERETGHARNKVSTTSNIGQEDHANDSNMKTPNENLREWLEFYLESYMDTLYDRDSPPTSAHCAACANPSNVFHRCTSCIGVGIICTPCVKSLHQHNPTHRIKSWDGTLWASSSLSDLGHALFLGHNGKACPTNEGSSRLYVGDLNGFTHTRVRYCTCNGALSKPRQLLHAGLFPCSHRHPKSALTFPLLNMYYTLTTRARTSGYKYYSALEQLTKPGFSADVDD